MERAFENGVIPFYGRLHIASTANRNFRPIRIDEDDNFEVWLFGHLRSGDDYAETQFELTGRSLSE